MSHQLYGQIALETEQITPHKQILLLLEKCLQSVQLAKRYIAENNIPEKCRLITKATDIVSYLRSILNKNDESSKKLTEQLDGLYLYAERALVFANMDNDIDVLNQVAEVITHLKTGWETIG